MRYGLGIDLGTSFTSAAVSGPAGTRMVPMSPAVVVPSAAYRTPDGALLTGDAALYPGADPGQVARNFKRRLGDPTPLFLGGAGFSPTALMAAQLRDVLATAIRSMGGPPDSVVLTYPAIWGRYRRQHFTEVPRLAHVPNFHLVTEPEAAATHYSSERRLGDGEVIAVYDLGGGTFDSTILRMRAGRMEILGTPDGIDHLGGADFDQAIFDHLDRRLDGAISALDPDDPRSAYALATIETMCVRAKESLSSEPEVRLNVPLPTGPRELGITRQEFNALIARPVGDTVEALHRTIASAGLRADQLSAVLLAGGSSRVPLVAQQLAREFGKPVRGALHPKYTVALGAAQVSARARPAVPPSSVPTGVPGASAGTPSTRTRLPKVRRAWLVSGIAAVAALLVGVVAIATSGPGAETIYAGAVSDRYSGFIASAQDEWRGTEFSHELDGAMRVGPEPGGLRATWNDGQPAQLYIQTKEDAPLIDLRPYLSDHGALVFTANVRTPPAHYAGVAIHCGHPCGGEVPADDLFRRLPTGTPTPIKIPLDCFTKVTPRPEGVPSHELNEDLKPDQVDTPFLVYSDKRMDVTFSDIRLEPGAADDENAMSCGALH
ncbi:Hsp70 family protein [Saccharopolyspora gloriosae]|uniref:Hsp70 family protein n=1 Tax=Saccharopolyspora gloriosae TaxID=455344 RepID=UPI001FB793A7|nr:Hsp70 family protein [Saccharopolyspora gloriosae]